MITDATYVPELAVWLLQGAGLGGLALLFSRQPAATLGDVSEVRELSVPRQEPELERRVATRRPGHR